LVCLVFFGGGGGGGGICGVNFDGWERGESIENILRSIEPINIDELGALGMGFPRINKFQLGLNLKQKFK